uniref:Uncharacterized protein n=1 Tax=Ananas comosus var. bracteatus TaxID=296719 RepID=A0A6V7P3R1_ANACO|nr:unnamed protein product [Ananas comosus var. bracteatus]
MALCFDLPRPPPPPAPTPPPETPALDRFLPRRHLRRPRLRLSLPNSHAVLGPALGLISGAAIFVSAHRRSGRTNLGVESDTAVGDWILFTSPTPFNRCVLLRCPSVSFEDGGELLDGLNERLVREERHYVNLSRGRIPAAEKEGEGDG